MSVESMLVNKIRELQIENEELRAKLAPFEDEKLSLQRPLDNYEGDDVGNDYESDDVGNDYESDDVGNDYESDEYESDE
jgi:hypothetical protein